MRSTVRPCAPCRSLENAILQPSMRSRLTEVAYGYLSGERHADNVRTDCLLRKFDRRMHSSSAAIECACAHRYTMRNVLPSMRASNYLRTVRVRIRNDLPSDVRTEICLSRATDTRLLSVGVSVARARSAHCALGSIAGARAVPPSAERCGFTTIDCAAKSVRSKSSRKFTHNLLPDEACDARLIDPQVSDSLRKELRVILNAVAHGRMRCR